MRNVVVLPHPDVQQRDELALSDAQVTSLTATKSPKRGSLSQVQH